jgi:metal-responsive CopG/Arc/MetJ family transcriptional regulator
VKVSVSLPDDVIIYLDEYAHRQGYDSRSAVLLQAVRLLQESELIEAYKEAFEEWDGSEDAHLWEVTAGDGID